MAIKDIPDYEGLYSIDEYGAVYSKNGKLRKTKISHAGYVRVVLTKNNIQKSFMVHRLVAIVFVPNYRNKPFINHKDLNKSNNYYKNLEWCTASENIQHAVRNGSFYGWNSNKNGRLSGENNGRCKISDKELISARKSFNGKYGQIKSLAKKYNISSKTMSLLLNNKYRRNIQSQ